MIVYKNYTTFLVLGKEINLSSEVVERTRNTVAEVDDKYYYLGNEPSNVATAIFAWQDIIGRVLTEEEFKQVLIENNILSQAI